MHGSMSWKTLQTSRHIDQIVNIILFFICFLQFRIHGQRFINGNVQLLWDHLRNRVYLRIRHIQYTSNITDYTAGSQSTESNDLNDAVITVLATHIFNYFLSSFEAEVNVNIRHGNSFRIQESLKEQIITDRIKLCDSQSVGNKTSRGRTSSRSYHNIMVAGIFNEVPHNKEIIHVSHIFDGR